MEQEKYLKPHFSKYLKPLMEFLFHNSEYYNIPAQIKDSKDGPFKFPEESVHNTSIKFSKMHGDDSTPHLGDNSTAAKLKNAIKSAKRSQRRHNGSDYYGSSGTVSLLINFHRAFEEETSLYT